MKTISILSSFFLFGHAIAQTSNYDLLQGKWQSKSDKTNVLWFDGTTGKETNDSKTWDAEPFVLGTTCANETDLETVTWEVKANAILSCPESDLCWEIQSITPTELTLIYLGRGNTLTYTKIK